MEKVFLKRFGFNILIMLYVLLSMSAVAFAAGGDGNGKGANKDIPIAITSSNISNGQKNVAVDAKIELVFNKNVVNMKVATNNKNCFSLVDEQGTTVPITIQMADDQVDPVFKRNITVVPNSHLAEGTKYTLTISENFMAKNGATLLSPIHMSFTTAGPTSVGEPTINEVEDISTDGVVNQTDKDFQSKEQLEEQKTDVPKDDFPSSVNENIEKDIDALDDGKEGANLNTVLIGLFIIVTVSAILLYLKLKKQHES